ncbi:uncharacterized protein LOC134256820 isoform X1 [Saccostrea cucullata]|uniref:uncharacterized protein LOC134256820 isoform X1 n=1 Tax=Saccostrea cuccullata TaxID=36930 RepID=UPI002ECFF0CE
MNLLSVFTVTLLIDNSVSALLCGFDTYVEYNTPEQICCNGTVTRRDSFSNPNSVGCCKDTLYNNETDMCCGGAVGPKSWLCCNGVLHRTKDFDSYGCNGTDLYRLPKKDIVKSTTREPSCKSTIFEENKLVCGSSLYNTEQETCCNRTVHTKSPNVLCCKDVLYNTSTHVCCEAILRPKSRLNERISCCGTDPYDPDRSLCCNGIKYEKSSKLYGCCDTKPYRFSHDMCCISKVYGQSKKMQCCGTETFDREKQYCYNDNEILGLNEGKCGERRYSTLKHMCCDQTLIANRKGYRCCGSSLFNPKVNDCDMKHIVQKGFLWCESGNYNPDTHDCCEGQVMKRGETSWRCCGARMINYDVNGCCGAGHPFNKRNQQCCGGNVIQIEGKCCANQQMNSTQLCCGKTKDRHEEIITKKEPYHDKCCPHKCGGVSYDSVNSICSWENIVINKTKTFNICGKKRYNPKVDLCCNQKLFKKKREKGMTCCNPSSIIYHPKTHFCENGEIKSICPAKCKNITLKNFCKKENPRTRTIKKGKIIAKEFRNLLENHKTCQCVYARDQGRKCKRNGKQCRRNRKKRKLMGIFVVKTRINSRARDIFWYLKSKRHLIKRKCKKLFNRKV